MKLAHAIRETIHEVRAAQLQLPTVPTLAQIQALERAMRDMGGIELPVSHQYAEGLYARELFMPADSCLVGKMHRKSHFFVLLHGAVTAWTPDGMKRLVAPLYFVTVPGTKRAIYAHTDARLLTFHATALTDVDAIEAEIIVPAESETDFALQLEMAQATPLIAKEG